MMPSGFLSNELTQTDSQKKETTEPRGKALIREIKIDNLTCT